MLRKKWFSSLWAAVAGAAIVGALALGIALFPGASAPGRTIDALLEAAFGPDRTDRLGDEIADTTTDQCQPAGPEGQEATRTPEQDALATLQYMLRTGAMPLVQKIGFSQRPSDGDQPPADTQQAELTCPSGYGLCPNGRCCPTSQLCSNDGYCVERGRNYCGGGRSCPGGESCTGDGYCVKAGQVYCGGGRTCPSGTACTKDGRCADPNKPTCPPGQGLCSNGKCCPIGKLCTNDGYCMDQGRVYCGGGLSCPAGTTCSGQGTCITPGSGGPTPAPAPRGSNDSPPTNLRRCIEVSFENTTGGYKDRRFKNTCNVGLDITFSSCDSPSFGGACTDSKSYLGAGSETFTLSSYGKPAEIIRVCYKGRCE